MTGLGNNIRKGDKGVHPKKEYCAWKVEIQEQEYKNLQLRIGEKSQQRHREGIFIEVGKEPGECDALRQTETAWQDD